MALAAYFDESGTHDGSEAVAVAGYLSTPELWQAFETEWRGLLADFGIDLFHMTDFAASARQFSGWPEEKRRNCFGRLVRIINQHIIGSVGTVIPMKDYEAVFAKTADDFIGHAYGLAAVSCQMQLAEMLRLTGVYGNVAYFFELGALGRTQLERTFRQTIEDPSNRDYFRLLSLTFQDKRELCPLQAADVLAYELYKYFPKYLNQTARANRYGIISLGQAPRLWETITIVDLARWSEIITIRAGLDEREVVGGDWPVATGRPAILISVDELKERWRWWSYFKGQTNGPPIA